MTQDIAPMIRGWLHDSASVVPDPVQLYPGVAAVVHDTRQQNGWRRWLAPPHGANVLRASSLAVVAMATAMVAGLVFVSTGGDGPQTDLAPAAIGPTATATATIDRTAAIELVDPSTTPEPLPMTEAREPGVPAGPNVRFEAQLVLPGQVQTAWAEWCDKRRCVPATLARWVVEATKYRHLIEPRRGSPVRVTAKDKVGGMSILVKGRWGEGPNGKMQGTSYSTGVTVRPPPGQATTEWRRRHGGSSWVFPDEQVLRLGQSVALTAWSCPDDDYGTDDRPGTTDDACEVSTISSARPLPGSGMSLLGLFGPSAVFHVDEFVHLGGALNAAGVFLRYDEKGDDIEIPWLYVRDEPWQGSPLGDLDGNGIVNGDDAAVIDEAIAATGVIEPVDTSWDGELDVNTDRRIDEVDLQIVEALATA